MVEEEKILDVAYKLFRQKGVRTVSLQNIARSCGISPWDLNLKFKSKKELLLAVVKHLLTKKSSYLLINTSLSPSAAAELNNFFKFVDDNINELGPAILSELRRYHPIAFDQLQELVDMRLMPHLQRIIARGLSEGLCRNNLDYELYVLTYFYMIRSVLENNNCEWAETRRMIQHINDLFLHGALNVKGMRM